MIEFVKTAFDATDIERITRPDGSVMHAQMTIGSSMLMMGGATVRVAGDAGRALPLCR
ncbi:MAG TPA: hypothetical protein VES39_00585 [Rhodospirillales bacterium]|nr:hypothetical protein [Rhodospirillales bacterium]